MKLKSVCEDFQVFEVIDESLFVDEPTQTHLYILKKRNYTTERAVSHVAKALGIPRKFISYAGTKDKNAVTEQLVSIKGTNKDKVEKLDLKDIELSFKGYSRHALSLGELKGNRFEITIRDVKEFPEKCPKDFIVPNYFDEQRFSTNNVDIGLAIVKRDFKKAVELILSDEKDFKEDIDKHLAKQQNDYVGALRKIPRRILLMYVHALQSKIYNDILATHIDGLEVPYSEGNFKFFNEPKQDFETKKIPLVGYLSKLTEEELKPLNELDIVPRSFLIPPLPEMCLEGSDRESFFVVNDFEIKEKGENFLKVSFVLTKGSYATIVIKQIFAMNGIVPKLD